MTDRKTIKLPEPLATDLEAHKDESQTWPAFIREDVLPALEGDGGGRGTDVAERLDRIESAAKEATSAAQSAEQAINEVVDR